MKNIGLDLGTFHTVAVSCSFNKVEIPTRSVPSIAILLPQDKLAVGVDAIDQRDLPFQLIVAPKLLIKKSDSNQIRISDKLVLEILRKLINQSLDDLGIKSNKLVLTVPPAWTSDDCKKLKGISEEIGVNVIFLHEPVALLVALMKLSRMDAGDKYISGRLNTASRFLVCDWGAGTVDVALVDVNDQNGQLNFQCIGDFTDLDHGGNNIALDVVSSVDESIDSKNLAKSSFKLQLSWQESNLSFIYKYATTATKRRIKASKFLVKKIEKMLDNLGVVDLSNTVFLLYGGPLESDELYSQFCDQLNTNLDVKDENILRINENFISSYRNVIPNIRRDVLVAYGASLFGISGQALPEFEYEIALVDSSGNQSICIRLVKGLNLRGIQIIKPPFTGVDYFVKVRQIRRVNNTDSYTSIHGELRLYVRVDAVIQYSIIEAGVGFAKIEAKEVKNLPYPEPFSNSGSDQVILPEKSTNFSICLES